MDKEEIIKRISALRTKRRFTARALSQSIGKNDAYINRMESKKDFLPTIESLLDILEVCECSTEEFFYYDMNQYQIDKEIIETLKGLDTDSKKSILEIMKKLKK